MVNTDKLQGLMKERRMSSEETAKAIGITPTTFYRRLKAKMFKSNEIKALIEVLNIEDPITIFFA